VTWDVLLLRVPPEITTAADLSEEAVIPLGTPAEVRQTIQRACPQAHFSDATTGELQAPEYRFHISLGDEEPVRGVLLLVSGNVDAASITIGAICAATDWRALDMNTEEFVDLP
jgi:hypothetical protein